MELDADRLLKDSILAGVRDCIKGRFDSYNSPLDKLLKDALETHAVEIRTLLEEAIGSCVNDPIFRSDIAAATRHSLAKMLIQRFGGEIEKQVNLLKSDPTTRARIVLAIEEIVKSKA